MMKILEGKVFSEDEVRDEEKRVLEIEMCKQAD